jgi:type II secretory pathway component PulM
VKKPVELLARVRQQLAQPRFRNLPILVAGVSIVAMLFVLFWLPGVQSRQHAREEAETARLRELQKDLAAIEKLNSAAAPRLAGNTLLETVSASLSGQVPSLSPVLVDADHVRVQGNASFDTTIHWLGAVQKSHRLGVSAMVVSRQESGIAIDLTLVAGE